MKVKYIGISGAFRTGGKVFQKGVELEVSKEVAKFLKEKYANQFEIIEDTKPTTKSEVDEVKPSEQSNEEEVVGKETTKSKRRSSNK